MCDHEVINLEDCTEFRQTLQARPPAVVHGAVVLLAALLGTGLLWTALTDANLVVRATGHVRPATSPRQVFIDFHGDLSSAGLNVTVVEVKYQQGDEVRQGDVLVRLDVRRLESEIKKRESALRDGAKELSQLSEQKILMAQQFEKARQETAAELTQITREIERAKAQQIIDIQTAEKELDTAQRKLARGQQLFRNGAMAAEEYEDLGLRARKADGELKKARLPILEEKVEVARHKLERLQKDQLLKQADLDRERTSRERGIAIARAERDRLELERQQANLTAPIAGIVTSREVKVGDLPEPGKPVVEIAEQKGFHFEATISSEDVAPLRVGMPVRIKLDAFDFQKYGMVEGKVCFISPDAKVVEGQRVARYVVKIELQGEEVGRGDLRNRIKLGMAGQAEIVTDRESLLSLLLKRIRQSISLD